MAVTEFFDDFAALDTTRWQARTAGSGSVVASDSLAVLDEGGTASGDVAALVLKTPMDLASDWVLRVLVRIDLTNFPGAFTPNIVGFYDGSAVPDVMNNASRLTAQRIWVENQMDATAANNRWQYRFRNPSGTLYTWRNSSNDWDTTFEHSHSQANEGNYLLIAVHYKAASGFHVIGYGRDTESASGANQGFRHVGDTTFKGFGSQSATDIDNFDNSAYLVIGDLVNDQASNNHDAIHSVEYVALHGVRGTRREAMWLAGADASGGFPFPYNIYEYLCPEGAQRAGHPFWIPFAHHPNDTVVVSRGADHWVQDPYVYEVG